MLSIKQKLAADLAALTARVPNPERKKSNTSPLLYEIYVAQELVALAEKKEKKAWAALEANGFIPSDAQLRKEEGERIVTESGNFTCIVDVKAPRHTFDREAFIVALAKKYKLPIASLNALAEETVKTGTPPLSKRVMEV